MTTIDPNDGEVRPSALGSDLAAARAAIADHVFDLYEFGGDVVVVAHDNWNQDDITDFTKIVYVTYEDDPPGSDSNKVSFHVRFGADGQIDDAYALEMERGNDIGQRGDVVSGDLAALNASSENAYHVVP